MKRKRKKIVTPEQVDRAVAMFASSALQREVASSLGISPTTAWKIANGWRPTRQGASLENYEVDQETGCWIFQGYRCKDGYGHLPHDGRQRPAHRVAWCLKNGIDVAELRPEQVVRHKCDNPGCVNPEHLEIGTPAQNAQDCVRRGPSLKGMRHNQAKLTKAQVVEIRESYSSEYGDQTELARRFGVSQSAIWAIVRRKTWKHIA